MRTVGVSNSAYKVADGISSAHKLNASGIRANVTNAPTGITEPRKFIPIKNLTREKINENKRKGLCFFCDEPYINGHVCQQPQLFMMIPSDEGDM